MGPTEALSLAFRVVLAVGAATSPADSNHRQVGSSPTIWWPARTAGIALIGGRQLAISSWRVRGRGTPVCRSQCDESAVGKMLTLGDRPDAPARKMSAGAAFASLCFSRNRNRSVSFSKRHPALRLTCSCAKLVACSLLTEAPWKNSNHFIVSHLLSSPCFSPVVLARRNPPPPQAPPNLSLPWTEKVVTASRP